MPAPSLTLVSRQAEAVPRPALSCDLFPATPADAGWAGFVAAHLAGPVLWVQDRLSTRETGRPSILTTPQAALLLQLSHPRDVLMAAEEALACRALSGVVAEVWGDPAALDFTATKRLALRAERSGRALWLIRHAGRPDLSAARDRWRIASLPSAPHPDDPKAPGAPRWRVELFRSRDKHPGVWEVARDARSGRLDFAPLPQEAAPRPAPLSRAV